MTTLKPEIEEPFDSPNISSERVAMSILTRYNPARLATPERLGLELDSLYAGRLTISRYWDMMQRRGDFIGVADSKRKDAVGRMEWQIIEDPEKINDGNKALAEQQKKVLCEFYANLECTDVLRQDMEGGVNLLVSQMIDAKAKGFAVHEWIWKPRAVDGEYTTACFRFCPLYWFENLTGKLRFLRSEYEYSGADMADGEWLVSVSDGYMERITSIWVYANALVKAWVRYCERYGFPLPHARTGAVKDSPEWQAVVDAVGAINEDFGLVTSSDVELILHEAKNAGTSPFAALLERFDRIVPVIILGSDLSTISAGSGQGQGASLQAKEDAKREAADAQWISETLNEKVDEEVIEYVFGPEAPLLVRFQLVPPKSIDVAAELQVDQFLVNNGVPVAVRDIQDRYGRKAPAASDELLRPINAALNSNSQTSVARSTDGQAGAASPGAAPGNTDPGATMANSGTDISSPEDAARQKLVETATREAAVARAEDLHSVVRELEIIMGITDPGEMMSALKRWIQGHQDRARRIVSTPGRLAPALEQLISAAMLNGMEATPKE